jgi:hypothetical protein
MLAEMAHFLATIGPLWGNIVDLTSGWAVDAVQPANPLVISRDRSAKSRCASARTLRGGEISAPGGIELPTPLGYTDPCTI